MKQQCRLIITALLLVACADKRPVLDDQTVAVIGNHAISLEAYTLRYANFLFESGMKDNLLSRRQVAENFAHEIILKYYDDNRHIESDPEYIKELAWAENEMILAYLKDKEIYEKITVSEQEVRQAFQRSKEKLAARHLYAPDLETADSLYDALNRGFSFNELAKAVFSDTTLKNNGGYIGYFTWGEMDPAFEDMAFSMTPGDISRPVKTAQGYSIIKLEDRIPHPLITEAEYQKAKPRIEQLLKISLKSKAEENYINTVFEEDKLQFYTDGLQTVTDHFIGRPDTESELPLHQRVYSYKNKNFDLRYVINQIDKIPAFHRTEILDRAMIKTAIQSLIIQNALLDKARSLGYDKVPQVRKAVEEKQNITFLKYKRNEIILNAEVGDSSLIKFFEENRDHFSLPRKINVYEILFAEKDLAHALKEKILAGADFSEIAREYSLRSWSAERGGEIGMSELDRFGDLKFKLWNAPLNKIIGPIDIKGFYGLFKVVEKSDAETADYQAVRDEVLNEYRIHHSKKITQDYLRIKYDALDLKINYPLIRNFVFDQISHN